MKDPKDKTEEEPSACETKQVGDIGKEPGKTPAELEDDDLESVAGGWSYRELRSPVFR